MIKSIPTALVPIFLALAPGSNAAGFVDEATKMQLANVRHWGYNIQQVHTDRQYNELSDSHFDLYVLEVVVTEVGMQDYDIAGLIYDIRQHNMKIRGVDPIVLAYVDMGQAEDWRWYWEKGWKVGDPDWIVAEDPDGWEGNYQVAYWHPEWESIVIYGHNGRSHVDETIAAGFDGIYMDWVEGFSNLDIIKKIQKEFSLNRPDAEVHAAKLMFDFIEKIRTYAQASDPDYLIVAQNASDLYENGPARYESIIDAIALEAIWIDGASGDNWNDRRGYNIRTNDLNPGWTEEVLEDLEPMKGRFPIFCAEYAQNQGGKELATKVYKSLAPGVCVPYATRRALSRLSTTPYPKGYQPRDYSRPPSRPRLQQPANGATVNDSTPRFNWRNSKGYPKRYRIQVDDNANFSRPEINARPGKSQYTARARLDAGEHYWRVKAGDIVNDWSRWSKPRRFHIPAGAAVAGEDAPADDPR